MKDTDDARPGRLIVLDMMRAANRPAFETLSPAEARIAYAASRAILQPDPEDVAEARDMMVPGPLGDIPIRVYRPLGRAATEVLPVLVYYHGGGWLLGDLDSHDDVCRRFANLARCARGLGRLPHGAGAQVSRPRSTIASRRPPGCVAKRRRSASTRAGRGRRRQRRRQSRRRRWRSMARDGDLPPLAFQLLIYPATDMTMRHGVLADGREGVPLTSDHHEAGSSTITCATTPTRARLARLAAAARPTSPAPRRRWC